VPKKNVPIIILNWNGADDTLLCVQHVLEQDYQDFIIFLLDNNSEQPDKDRLNSAFANHPKIELRFYKENYGFSKAHQKVVAEDILPSGYDCTILLNNDAFAEKDWLGNLLKCRDEEKADMVSCKMIQFEKRNMINNLGHKFLNTGEILPIACDENPDSYQTVFQNAGGSGGAVLYSNEMIKEIGFYDSYFVTGYEDAEFGLRALVAGYHLVFCPSSIVYHKVGASVNKVRTYDFTLKIQLDIIYSYFKLMPVAVILANLPWVVFRQIALMLIFGLFGRFIYIKIFFHAWYLMLTRDWQKLHTARKEAKPHIRLSNWQILKRQEFFLKDNIKRFFIYFIKGEKTIFEKFK